MNLSITGTIVFSAFVSSLSFTKSVFDSVRLLVITEIRTFVVLLNQCLNQLIFLL